MKCERDYFLVQKWIEGDKEAGLLLVSESYDSVLKLAFQKIKSYPFPNPDEVLHDITQEAFGRAVARLSKFDGTSSFFTWVCGFIPYCLKEYVRKNKLPILANDIESCEDLFSDSEFPVYSNPELAYLHKEENEAIHTAFHALKQDYRNVLHKRLILGMRYNDIAILQEKSVEALESLFRRAVKALREEFL